MLRVIGAGVGRTGTTSLKLALEQLLGGPCYHMLEVFPRPAHLALWESAARGERVTWSELFEGFHSTVDWPSAAFWPELAEAYPDAIILLSNRDPEAWWKSAQDTIFQAIQRQTGTPMRAMMDALLERRFTTAIDDREAAIAAYEKHNAHVRATAPRHRLLEWSPRDGWEPLCTALRVPVPDRPFPHVNTTDEFVARLAAPAPKL